MTSKRKAFRLGAYAALLLLGAGCGGLNVRQSVSPASFFLPGLLKADPPVAPSDVTLPVMLPAQQVALVR